MSESERRRKLSGRIESIHRTGEALVIVQEDFSRAAASDQLSARGLNCISLFRAGPELLGREVEVEIIVRVLGEAK